MIGRPIPWLVAALLCSLIPSLRGVGAEPAPPPKPIRNQHDVIPSTFRGKVMAVTDKSITVKPEGFVEGRAIRFLPDGQQEVVSVYKQDNTKPPMTFVFSDDLLLINGPLAGRLKGAGYRQHRIADVQVGDHVEIGCDTAKKGVAVCGNLQIIRRYGGRVPPAITDNDLPPKRQHLRVDVQRNAAQEKEEKAGRILTQVFLRFHL